MLRFYESWQLRMHCNLRPPEPRQLLPALIMTPCQVCGGVIATSAFDLMTFNTALRVVLRYGVMFTKFDLRQLICA